MITQEEELQLIFYCILWIPASEIKLSLSFPGFLPLILKYLEAYTAQLEIQPLLACFLGLTGSVHTLWIPASSPLFSP